MDQEQSIALWKKGKEAWNEWAEDMLVQRKKLEDSGEWSVKGNDWLEEASVDFFRLRFLQPAYSPIQEADKRKIVIINDFEIDFSGYIFPNTANFNFCEFGIDTNFGSSKFSGDAVFLFSRFRGATAFSSSVFLGNVYFNSSKFSGIVTFSSLNSKENKVKKFLGEANFRLAHFEEPVLFKNIEFEKGANFSSITSEKSFVLIDTKFTQAPDFTESSFHAPPVLDDMKIKHPLDQGWWTSRKTDARKFRALGKMAAEANDNQNAMEFFANEVRAKRGFRDKAFGKGSGRFWWGLLYDFTSNFGRSFIRPFVLWSATTLIFASLYWATSISKVNLFGEALYIAIRQGLVFSGLSRSDRWDSAIAALYGGEIPYSVSYMMLVQPIISAVWIFLFFLAMRKHFKIS